VVAAGGIGSGTRYGDLFFRFIFAGEMNGLYY
jgi:hypothetical protein